MKLSITDLNASFQVCEGYRLPFFSGSLWHGVLGHSLQATKCVTDGVDLFERFIRSGGEARPLSALPAESRLARQAPSPPPRLIPILSGVGGAALTKGDRVQLSVRVFGRLSPDDLSGLQQALTRVADFSVGTDQGRLEVIACTAGPTILLDTSAEIPQPASAGTQDRLLLTLLTPLCIKQRRDDRYAPPRTKKVLLQYIDFATLFEALHRRLTLLCSQFGEYTPEDEFRFREQAKRARDVHLVMSQLRHPKWKRESQRSRSRYAMSGLLGSLLYEGALARYAPYLRMAEATHIGSDTSFGLGRVRFEWLSTLDTALQPIP